MVRLVYSFVRLAAEEGEMKDGTIEISKGRKEQKKAESYISLQLSSSASIRTAIITHEAIFMYVIHSLLGIRLAWLGLAWSGWAGIRTYIKGQGVQAGSGTHAEFGRVLASWFGSMSGSLAENRELNDKSKSKSKSKSKTLCVCCG